MQSQYQIVEIDPQLMEDAGQLVQRYPLRAYDSVQLAAALKLQPASTQVNLIFVSADNRLLITAQTEGLATNNPNLYP